MKKRPSLPGESFAEFAKQFIAVGYTDAGVLVANSASEVVEAQIAELQTHKMPEFSCCQPLASFPGYPDVEEFLRGPEEKFL